MHIKKMETDSKDNEIQDIPDRGVIPPTLEELDDIANQHCLNLSGEELNAFNELIAGAIISCMRIDELEELKPTVKYPRDKGRRPAA